MDDHVSDVVEGFLRLSSEEQTRAYMDIEKIWKTPQQDGTEAAGNRENRPLPG
jgi:hypothetical protein